MYGKSFSFTSILASGAGLTIPSHKRRGKSPPRHVVSWPGPGGQITVASSRSVQGPDSQGEQRDYGVGGFERSTTGHPFLKEPSNFRTQRGLRDIRFLGTSAVDFTTLPILELKQKRELPLITGLIGLRHYFKKVLNTRRTPMGVESAILLQKTVTSAGIFAGRLEVTRIPYCVASLGHIDVFRDPRLGAPLVIPRLYRQVCLATGSS